MTKVYKYGALPGGDTLCAQMNLGRVYYNSLVEAENERRTTMWGGDRPPSPATHVCKKSCSTCDKAESKKRKPRKHECKKFCPVCRAHYKALRKQYRSEPPLDVKPFRKKAAEGGLYWGTYLVIEQDFSAAWKETESFSLVKFRSWRQGDMCAVQIQRDKDPDRMFLIKSAPDPRKKKQQRYTLRLRVGSKGQAPVWAEPLPFEMHRPLQGTATWVKIARKYVADRVIWSVQFTRRDIPERKDNAERGAVAIDVGWRKTDDGMRIAYARGDDGAEYELVLPPKWMKHADQADRIRSARDQNLVELQKQERFWSVILAVCGFSNKKLFARLKSTLSVRRVAKPGEHTKWIKKERHLWQYEAGCRNRSVTRRRNDVRVWLRDLRRRYAHAVIKDSCHKKMKENKTSLPKPARRQGHHAAPGEVIEEITRVFGRITGVSVVCAVDTTNHCPACSFVNSYGPERVVTCGGCGVVEDRDRVSTQNMMNMYAIGNVRNPTTRKSTPRFAKKHKDPEAP